MSDLASLGPGAGRRELTKAANRAAILRAAGEVFAEIGFGAASVRDVIRRTDLASGTFYNYFPDKESVLHALIDEIAVEARTRVRAARRDAGTAESFIAAGFRAYFAYLAEDPLRLDLLRRNAGTIRAMFEDPSVGAGVDELRDDLAAAVSVGLMPAHDTALMATAMMGAALEVGFRMLDEPEPRIERAVALLTTVFAAGLERMGEL
ncbi:MAG: TetR/AcrR family transcriptional regulator [Solirubrobacteraceae bacterium]|nr:TetR/AcrR family transcriptional regulator [Solirubrobacteraceae bacterium]